MPGSAPSRSESARTRLSAPSSSRTFEPARVASAFSTVSGTRRCLALAFVRTIAMRVSKSGWLHVGAETPFKARSQSRFEDAKLARWSVAGQNDLLSGLMQRIEGVEELFLSRLLCRR